MIQYNHYHSPEGYVHRVSSQAMENTKEIFIKLSSFQRNDGMCFTYYPTDERAYIFQNTKSSDGKAVFAQGLEDELSKIPEGLYPHELIGFLKKEYDNSIATNGVTECDLPEGRGKVDFTKTQGMRNIFPRIVDALMYTDMPVVLAGKSVSKLIDCVKIALSLFPAKYAQRIGFSACPKTIPAIFGRETNDIGARVRLIATDADVTPIEGWVVLNIDKPGVEEFGELRPYARAIQNLEPYFAEGNAQKIEEFLKDMFPWFEENGKINLKKLRARLTLLDFEKDQTEENAKALLRERKGLMGMAVDKNVLISAIKILLKKEVIDEESLTLITQGREDPQINAAVEQECGRYAFKLAVEEKQLTQEQKADAVAFLKGLTKAELNSDPIFNTMLSKRRHTGVFELLCAAYRQSGDDELLCCVYKYADVSAPRMGEKFIKEFVWVCYGEKETHMALLAAMLLSCLTQTSLNAVKKVCLCIEAIEQKLFDDEKEKGGQIRLAFAILEKAVEFGAKWGCALLPAEQFPIWKKIDHIVADLSYLEALQFANAHASLMEKHEVLAKKLLSIIYNAQEFKRNCKNDDVLSQFNKFLELYKDKYPQPTEIALHFSQEKQYEKVCYTIEKYRRTFIVDSYCHMPQKERARMAKIVNSQATGRKYNVDAKKHTDEIKDLLEDMEADNIETNKVTKILIGCIQNNEKEKTVVRNTLNTQVLLVNVFFSFLFALAAAAILCVAPCLIGGVLGESFTKILQRLQGYVSVGKILSVLGVGVFNLLTYLILWKTSNHDRVMALKRASKATWLYGLLSITAYTFLYVVTYFWL